MILYVKDSLRIQLDDAMEMTREASYFLRARNNILEILEARGFNVSSLVAEGLEEVVELFRDPKQIKLSYYIPHNDEGRMCKVLFGQSIASLLKDVEKEVTDTESESHEKIEPERDEVVLIVFGKLGDTDIEKTILRARKLKLQIDAIHIMNLQFNPLNHIDVPYYEPIPIGGEQEKEILDSVGVKKLKNFPLIRSYDIISRLLGLRPNQMVLVTSKSPAVRSVKIRVCVDS